MIQNSQAALGANFTTSIDDMTTWAANVIKLCKKHNILTVEPNAEAENNWVNEIVKTSMLRRSFLQVCVVHSSIVMRAGLLLSTFDGMLVLYAWIL